MKTQKDVGPPQGQEGCRQRRGHLRCRAAGMGSRVSPLRIPFSTRHCCGVDVLQDFGVESVLTVESDVTTPTAFSPKQGAMIPKGTLARI